uniref:Uncharacterized protein n=1 Tax=Geobacter sp. (strain M21) TaxID=443144 RepID=C6DZE9_GEOSM
MGKYNSTETRVTPIFKALMDDDPTGNRWLLPILTLGSRSEGRLGEQPYLLAPRDQRYWGKNERRLLPPLSLLKWLAENISAPVHESLWGGPATRAKRERLVNRDPATRDEALQLLKGPYRKAWYTLEGKSQPDAFFEGENFIVVIEGKRTERRSTTTTAWMPERNQMLRHMDAAWELAQGKKVLGLMIVEGEEPGKLYPSKHWISESDKVAMQETLTTSLPHRTESERDLIAEGYLGVTTWQRVCWELGVAWPLVE